MGFGVLQKLSWCFEYLVCEIVSSVVFIVVFIMTFFNAETFQPNIFLLNSDDQDVRNHARKCFCVRCRAVEVGNIDDRYVPVVDDVRKRVELHQMMVTVLPNQLLGAQDRVFEITQKLIIYGKLYHQTALSDGMYVLFKSWAKVQPFYKQFIEGKNPQLLKEFDQHCKLVNDCNYVYNNWDRIVNNLTDRTMTNIRARNFTVAKFRAAADFNWCISENERARGAAPSRKGDQLWTKDDVERTALHMLGVGRLSEADRHQSSRFCQQVERRFLEIQKTRRQENDSIDG